MQLIDPREREPAADPQWTLQDARGHKYLLSPHGEAPVTVGRDLSAEVSILDAGVSRHHANFCIHDGRLVVEDLHSQNGTFVNGRRIQSQDVVSGDVLTFGRVSLVLTRMRGPSSPPSPCELLDRLGTADAVRLLRIGRELAGWDPRDPSNLNRLFEHVLDLAETRRGAVLLCGEDAGQYLPVLRRPRDLSLDRVLALEGALASLVGARTLANESSVPLQGRFSQGQSEDTHGAVLLPLRARGGQIGVIYLERVATGNGSADHLALLDAFVWLAEPALREVSAVPEAQNLATVRFPRPAES